MLKEIILTKQHGILRFYHFIHCHQFFLSQEFSYKLYLKYFYNYQEAIRSSVNTYKH